MQNDITLIKDRANIVDVVGEYVRLQKAGTYHKACCPFHEEKTPSFTVTEERGTYHCFGCSKGGDVIAFIMEMETVDFREALQMLADRTGVELQKYSPEQKKRQDEKSKLSDLIAASLPFYEKQLWESTGGKKALEYLKNRGLSDAIIKKFHLGYAPDGWRHGEDYLKSQKFTPGEMVGAGMSIKKDGGGTYDRFRHRIMFPISDPLGKTVGYTARAMPGDDDAGAKYINTPESQLYHKGSVLYGIDLAKKAIKKEDRVILVEGNMDVIATHEAGIENVIAVSGTALTEMHIKILKRYTSNFTLFFDADDAGKNAARKSAQMCLARDINISLISLSGGKDAADIVQEKPERLKEIIAGAQSALSYFIQEALKENDIEDPHGKRDAIDSLLQLVGHIAHPIERDGWIEKISTSCNVRPEIIRDLLQGKEPPQKRKPDKQRKKEGASKPLTIKNPRPPTRVDALVKEIVRLALAFPEAWKILEHSQGEIEILRENETLKNLIDSGPGSNYDPLKFLQEKYPGSEGHYKQISSYAEAYARTHEDVGDAHREIIKLAKRAGEEHRKGLLIAYTQELKKVELSGDEEMKKQLIEKIQNFAIENHNHTN